MELEKDFKKNYRTIFELEKILKKINKYFGARKKSRKNSTNILEYEKNSEEILKQYLSSKKNL